jgi:hypothetical protein
MAKKMERDACGIKNTRRFQASLPNAVEKKRFVDNKLQANDDGFDQGFPCLIHNDMKQSELEDDTNRTESGREVFCCDCCRCSLLFVKRSRGYFRLTTVCVLSAFAGGAASDRHNQAESTRHDQVSQALPQCGVSHSDQY